MSPCTWLGKTVAIYITMVTASYKDDSYDGMASYSYSTKYSSQIVYSDTTSQASDQ